MARYPVGPSRPEGASFGLKLLESQVYIDVQALNGYAVSARPRLLRERTIKLCEATTNEHAHHILLSFSLACRA